MNRLTALAVAIAAMLALPATGNASQTFGRDGGKANTRPVLPERA